MNRLDVIFVRIYFTEAGGHMEKILTRLHDEEKVRGVTVFRGVSGFGKSGRMHSSSLLDMSLNLPVVIEFFDEPAKVDIILAHLSTVIEPGHIVSWPAVLHG